MYQRVMRPLFLLLLAVALFAQGAAAAEGKGSAKSEVKYKKVSGEVVSVSQESIVIKSRTKGNLKLAITKSTDREGPQVKAGDRATVNYRVDEHGTTATRITQQRSAGKAGKKQTAALDPGTGNPR